MLFQLRLEGASQCEQLASPSRAWPICAVVDEGKDVDEARARPRQSKK